MGTRAFRNPRPGPWQMKHVGLPGGSCLHLPPNLRHFKVAAGHGFWHLSPASPFRSNYFHMLPVL